MLFKSTLLYFMRVVAILPLLLLLPQWMRVWMGKEKERVIDYRQVRNNSAIRQIRHSETPRSQSITATTQLSLNVTLWLHCELAAEWSGSNEAEQRPRKREREKERMKGQKGERGRKCLNGAHWEEIGRRKERRERERRGSVETKDIFKRERRMRTMMT